MINIFSHQPLSLASLFRSRSHRPLARAQDIVDTAVKAGSFNTLVTAVKAAGLVDTLKGKGPFTVFAPTDDAFAKLPKGTVESLLKPENKKTLVSILTYHVVAGEVPASRIVGAKSKQFGVKSVEGSQHRRRHSQGRQSLRCERVEDRHQNIKRHHSCHRQRDPAAEGESCNGNENCRKASLISV